MPNPRHWEPVDSYLITGRGLVYSGYEPDPPFRLNEEIEINGKVSRIYGLERQMIAGDPRPGRPVGVLTESNRTNA